MLTADVTQRSASLPACPQWFLRLHLLCFVLFFAFSMMHYPTGWTYFIPGEPLGPGGLG